MIRSFLSFCAMAFTLASPYAYAKTENVTVQCDVEGPLYAGTIEIPDAANFVCKTESSRSYAVNVKQPHMILTFNQLSYAIGPDDAYNDRYDSVAACKQDVAKGLVVQGEYATQDSNQAATELQSGLSATASTYFDGKGALVNGSVGRCSFEVK